MKILGVISTTALLLLLGATIPAFAQEASHEQEAKPEAQKQEAKPEAQKQEAKPEAQKQQAKPEAQKQQAKPEAQKQQAKPEAQKQQPKPEAQKQQPKQAKQGEPGKTAGQQPAQRSAADEQRQRAVPALRLSARGSGRIPDDRFRANFGQGHRFVINEPVMVGGYSRFQYGDYWFGFVEPWPMGWFYTDQVYVDYIDGEYYLLNPFYPGVRVAITVMP